MIEAYAVNCRQYLRQMQFEVLLSIVNRDKQARIKRFLKHEDAQHTLIADILVRLAAHARLGLQPYDFNFYYNEYGKPFLEGYSDFHFNTSHSGDWVVCAIGNEPLGIDVECIEDVDLKIAERFFSDEEKQMLESKTDKEKVEYFYDLWTLKESYIKACGKGLSMSLDSFTVLKYSDRITFNSKVDKNVFYFKQYDVAEGYKLSICGASDDFGSIKIYDCNQLYDCFIDIGGTGIG